MTDKEIKQLGLVPANDIRVNTAIAPFNDAMLKEHGFESRAEVSKAMFLCMKKYGGVGLTCNQAGLPFRMFVMGNHLSLQNGKKYACWNPRIVATSNDTILMQEGCLTFPYLFLKIERPRTINVEFEDDDGKTIKEEFSSLFSRIYQHELDHTMGITFVEKVSKLKFDMAKKKAEKMYKRDLQLAEIEQSRKSKEA
tara:strand:- start:454 stop:1041 length:588 start_codon:yes stop_codon:yes gene_type:complete